MTWGQIRLLLQQFAPGVSLDIIDEKITSRYGLILDTVNWKGLEEEAYLETVAAYTTGTVSVTKGSATVTGSGTAWSSTLNGRQFLLSGDTALYTVTYVSATEITLDRAFEGNDATDAGYTILQSIYRLPTNDKRLKTISSPVTGLALDELTQEEFRELIGFPSVIGIAEKFVRRADFTDSGTGQVYHQVALYPLPTEAQGYPILQEQTDNRFDGTNTSDSPLPFVREAAILNGARADLCLEMGQESRAATYEARFQMDLKGMLHVENGKRGNPSIRMAPIYTRHRAARVLRSFGGTTIVNDSCGA
jgi:hypothetical protein